MKTCYNKAVVTVQRDWGDRSNRKHARLKYTIEDRGLDAFRAEVEKHAAAKLTALAQKEIPATVPVFPVVRHGAPWEEITHVAKDRKADLIVIGTRGYTGLKHMVLGSTAEKVVRYAGCPVLVVREYGNQSSAPR